MYRIIGADGKEYGPISAEVLKQWIAEGRANGMSRVLLENTTEWKLLKDLPEFVAVLGAMAAPATPAPFNVPPTPGKTNPLAITGLILGILSVTIGLCCCGVLFSIAGLICSAIALSQISKNPQQQGRGIAITGLVLSILGLVFGALVFILYGVASGFQEVIRKVQHL